MKEQNLQKGNAATPELWENPFGLLRRLTGEMERLFDWRAQRVVSGLPLIGEAAWIPSIDVFQKNGSLVVRADLPGLTKDDVKIEVTEDAITVQGERKKEVEEEKEGYYRLERAFGSFYRAVPLPEGVKPEAVKATFKDGVLEIIAPLPPARTEPQARRVEIQEAAAPSKDKTAA
jgi:HSP20 family protein